MNSRKRRLICIDLTKAQRNMNISRSGVPISHQLKLAVGCLQRSFADTLNGALVGNTIVNKIRDRADLYAVLLHEAREGRSISESEMCYDVTRTVCTQTETTSDVEVCGVSFETVEQGGIAKSVQVRAEL